MSEFSLDLNEDQLQLQKWVHDFAENVIRPAAHEWDEREETPGRSSRRRPRSACTPSTSSPTPSSTRPACSCPSPPRSWPGVTPASPWPSSAAPSAWPASPATAPPSSSWSGARSASAPPRRSSWPPSPCPSPTPGPTCRSLRTRAVYDEAKDEWVLNGTKTWITNGGIADIHVVVASVDPELGSRGQASFIVPPEHPGPLPGPEVPEDGHPGLAHRRGRPRRLPGPGPLPARRQGEARREAGPGPGGQEERWPGGHEDLRGLPPDGRRPGPRHRPGRLRVLARLRQGAQGLRPGHHREPGASPSSWPT